MQYANSLGKNTINNFTTRAMKGFTLLELMIVIVVVGILMSIALPSYTEHIRKGRRSDAMSALLDVANRQEQLMFDRNSYTLDMTDLGFAADPMVSKEGFYTIDTVAGSTGSITTSYRLTATPVASEPQSNDTRCALFRLASNGTKTATGTHSTSCWSR